MPAQVGRACCRTRMLKHARYPDVPAAQDAGRGTRDVRTLSEGVAPRCRRRVVFVDVPPLSRARRRLRQHGRLPRSRLSLDARLRDRRPRQPRRRDSRAALSASLGGRASVRGLRRGLRGDAARRGQHQHLPGHARGVRDRRLRGRVPRVLREAAGDDRRRTRRRWSTRRSVRGASWSSATSSACTRRGSGSSRSRARSASRWSCA